MKKVFLLGTLFLLLLSNTVFAANWQWVMSDDRCGWFFDTDAIHYELTQPLYSNEPTVDATLITFWVKTVFTPEGANELVRISNNRRYRNTAYSIVLKTASLRHKTYVIRQATLYDKSGKIIETGKGVGVNNYIIPGSYDDAVFLAVRDYARTHHAQLIHNAYNN